MRPSTFRRCMDVLRLREEGLTFHEIGERMEPPVTPQRVHTLYQNALTELAKVPVAAEREACLRRLDRIAREAWRVIRTDHYVVAGKDGTVAVFAGAPVLDDAPKIKALEVLLRVEQRRAKLLGLDAPIRHEVLTIDQLDAEIARLSAALGERGGPATAGATADAAPATAGV